MTNFYHSTIPGLRTGLVLKQPTGVWNQTNSYDYARRLYSLGSPAGTFTYQYINAGLTWTNLLLPSSLSISNVYDSLYRLTYTGLKNSAGTVTNSHAYQYNLGSQRTNQTRTDASYVRYGYDNDGQLQSALGYNSGGTPIATEQKGYFYDASWNLARRTNNGSTTTFTCNNLNQISNGVYSVYTYDNNGNLLTEGYSGYSDVYRYTYDDENQLASVEYWGAYGGTPTSRTVFVYDAQGRMRKRQEYTWYSGSWYANGTTEYLYDRRLVIQERNSANTPTVSYTRGPDLSGSLQGAGGIGGLLSRSHGYSAGNWTTHNYYHADAGGNITALSDTSGTLTAAYRYDAFGNSLFATGSLASANVYRFLSKEYHVASGLYYYGFRFYNPSNQRWLNRDPIGEEGGANLYMYCHNNTIQHVDMYGLSNILISVDLIKA